MRPEDDVAAYEMNLAIFLVVVAWLAWETVIR